MVPHCVLTCTHPFLLLSFFFFSFSVALEQNLDLLQEQFINNVLPGCPFLTTFVWRAHEGGELRCLLQNGAWMLEVLAEPLNEEARAQWGDVFGHFL